MEYETIVVEKQNHIGMITLNRADQLNTFTTALATELNQALVDMDDEEDIRVILIKGNGRVGKQRQLDEIGGVAVRYIVLLSSQRCQCQ